MNNPTYVKIVFWTITNKYRILYLSFSRADAQHLEYNQNCATVVKLTWLKISYVKAWWVSEIIYTLIKYIHVCIKGLSALDDFSGQLYQTCPQTPRKLFSPTQVSFIRQVVFTFQQQISILKNSIFCKRQYWQYTELLLWKHNLPAT